MHLCWKAFWFLGRRGAQNPIYAFPFEAHESAQLMLSKHCLQAVVCVAQGPLFLPATPG